MQAIEQQRGRDVDSGEVGVGVDAGVVRFEILLLRAATKQVAKTASDFPINLNIPELRDTIL